MIFNRPALVHCVFCIVSIQPGGWIMSIGLINAYLSPLCCSTGSFTVGEGIYQYCCLPSGYLLVACTFSKCVEMVLRLLSKKGMRILTCTSG